MHQASVVLEYSSMGPVIHTANAQEERRGNKAMAQHQNQGSFDPLKVEREQAKCDESHMGHRRVGNDLLQVNLPQGGKGSIDDPDKAQRVHQRHEVQRSHWGREGWRIEGIHRSPASTGYLQGSPTQP